MKSMKNTLPFSHPCFSNETLHTSRIHLAVAPKCNIRCNFCRPTVDVCAHGCAPGITARLYSPNEALAHLRLVIESGVDIQIVGIAGPGEPLSNEETFETIQLVKAAFPYIHICLSTNGLLLPGQMERIVELGIKTLTVTVNAVSAEVGEMIYSVKGREGIEGVRLLMHNQLAGIKMAAKAGLFVKVNTVYVPGINDHEIKGIAAITKEHGAYIHNILSIIPRGRFADIVPPDKAALKKMQDDAGTYLTQFLKCRHCRADAVIDGRLKM